MNEGPLVDIKFPIYTIAACYIPEDGADRGRRYRTMGFFFDIKDAIEAVKENRGDMYECLYNYLVIERYFEGIQSIGEMMLFYRWDSKEKGWKQLDSRPAFWANTCNIGL